MSVRIPVALRQTAGLLSLCALVTACEANGVITVRPDVPVRSLTVQFYDDPNCQAPFPGDGSFDSSTIYDTGALMPRESLFSSPVPPKWQGKSVRMDYTAVMADSTIGYFCICPRLPNRDEQMELGISIAAAMPANCPQVNPGDVIDRDPRITALETDDSDVAPGNTAEITCVASDSETATPNLDYQWSYQCDDATVSLTLLNDTTDTVSFVAPAVTADKPCDLSCTVTDDGGNSVTSSTTIEISGNNPPVATLSPSAVTVLESYTFELECCGNDPDGDPVSYDWSLPFGWTRVNIPEVVPGCER